MESSLYTSKNFDSLGKTGEEMRKSSGISSPRKNLRTIYIITPTYKRPEQIPDLTRLSQTLMHVPSILWLLVEDAAALNPHVAEIAKRSKIPFVHMFGKFLSPNFNYYFF